MRRLSSSYNKNAAYERELKRDEYRKLIKRIQRQSQQYIGNRERRIVTRERLGVIFSDTGSEDEREEEKGAEGDIERRMVKQPRSQPKDVVRRKRPYRRRQPLDGGLVSQTSPLQKVKRKYTRREVGTKTVNRLTDGETRRVNDNEEEGVVLAKKRRYRRRLPSAGHRNVDDDQLRMRKRRHQFRIEGRCRLAGSRGRGGLFRRRGVWIDRRTDPGACYKQSRDVEVSVVSAIMTVQGKMTHVCTLGERDAVHPDILFVWEIETWNRQMICHVMNVLVYLYLYFWIVTHVTWDKETCISYGNASCLHVPTRAQTYGCTLYWRRV